MKTATVIIIVILFALVISTQRRISALQELVFKHHDVILQQQGLISGHTELITNTLSAVREEQENSEAFVRFADVTTAALQMITRQISVLNGGRAMILDSRTVVSTNIQHGRDIGIAPVPDDPDKAMQLRAK